MQLSFAVGVVMLFLKVYAYAVTDSAAILSDAAESVVHLFGVGFAVYSMWLSHKPADENHRYGHDRIAFFSAGFEGAVIIGASLYIIFQAIKNIIYLPPLAHLDVGMFCIACATALNGFLGVFLLRRGKKFHSLVLIADGKHIIADCITSLGVITALVLTLVTGWLYFDPIIALLIGFNILWTGAKLVFGCVHGLMDSNDPTVDQKIRSFLDAQADELQIKYHKLRHRHGGE